MNSSAKPFPPELVCVYPDGSLSIETPDSVCEIIDDSVCEIIDMDDYYCFQPQHVYILSGSQLVEVDCHGPWHSNHDPLSIKLTAEGYEDWHGYGTDH